MGTCTSRQPSSCGKPCGSTLQVEADLVLFAVASADVANGLRWEPSRGGQLFPHLFGDLPMRLVGNTATIAVAADGSVTLPEWVK